MEKLQAVSTLQQQSSTKIFANTTSNMSIYHLHREQQLKCTIDEAWEFFSTPRNLDKLTPKSVGFKITHCASELMHKGQIISYKVKVAPLIWLSWLTEISHVEHQRKFVDNQLSGPYKVWHHTHSFTENADGVMMSDDVVYVMPFGIIGNFVNSLLVRRQLNHIFDERARLVGDIFTSKSASST